MAVKRNNNSLGKGLRALIRDKETVKDEKKNLAEERHARNKEFYGSLMKKYISSRMEDDLLEEMLFDVRKHMGISTREHQDLLNTLKKREMVKKPRKSDQEKARSEIKEELAQIYQQIHGEEGSGNRESRFLRIERELEDKERSEAIPLPNGSPGNDPKVARIIRRRLVARNLDDRAGILENGKRKRGRRLEWLDEEEEKPLKMTPPREGLEDNDTTIRVTGPKEGLEDEDKAIIAMSPQEGLEDNKDIMMMKAPAEGLEDGMDTIAARAPERTIDSSKPLEMPPSTVPAGNGPGFEMVPDRENEMEEVEDHVDEFDEAEETGTEPSVVGDGKTIISPVEAEIQYDEDDVEEEREITDDLDDSLLSLKMLMEDGSMEEASSMADRLLSNDPDDVSILNEKGVILYNGGDVEGALEIYSRILKIEPDSVETLINYATLLSVKGEIDTSLECLDRAVKKDPYSEDAWNNKAVVYTRAGRLREALECLDEALRINEKTPSTWMNAGIVLERMGEIEPAMECYRNLLELEPGNEIALEGLEYCRSALQE